MNGQRESRKRYPVLLGYSSQIDIQIMLDRGMTFSEIDRVLGVPSGSSSHTMAKLRKKVS